MIIDIITTISMFIRTPSGVGVSPEADRQVRRAEKNEPPLSIFLRWNRSPRPKLQTFSKSVFLIFFSQSYIFISLQYLYLILLSQSYISFYIFTITCLQAYNLVLILFSQSYNSFLHFYNYMFTSLQSYFGII